MAPFATRDEAFGAVGAISDRICIHTNGRVHVNISAQDLVTCCANCAVEGNGCYAGYINKAWDFYLNEGIVTGGLYGTKDGCSPYSYPPSNQLGLSPHKKGRPPKPPACTHSCEHGNNKSYTAEKHYGKKIYSLSGDEDEIKIEVFMNGIGEGDFTVYNDLQSYKRGKLH
ncbi:cathepsin B [Rhipicephalus sanguineus]|uniref:cathepsin B n=1 Tax=Rhipicephalus sanguineus TaxID=34632 RepID=UPI0020C267EF|nr:cathepsin B [Rhipicephalus sanguineus]